jgi:hypothetical protein
MRTLFTLVVLLMVSGCHHRRPEPFANMWRQDDSRFSADDQRVIAAARAYLETNEHAPLDARYSIKRTQDGYEVFAMFVAGYENGRPLFYPGGHGMVVLRKDITVVRYISGD